MNEQELEALGREWCPPSENGDAGWKPLPRSYPDWIVPDRLGPLPPIEDARKAAIQNRRERSVLSDECKRVLKGWWDDVHMPAGACNCGAGHFHCYPITNDRTWDTWRQSPWGGSATPPHWWCGSLRDAARKYSWRPSKVGSFEHLSAALQHAIAVNDPVRAQIVCHAILDWGSVGRDYMQVRRWLGSAASFNIAALVNGAASLVPFSSLNPVPAPFMRGGLTMNSSSTKLFAATALDLSGGIACPKQDVLIYDGRVGAALGLLARRLMHKSLPRNFIFPWGAGRGGVVRNPSCAHQRFPPLKYTGCGPGIWAEFCRRGAECIQDVIGTYAPSQAFIEAERALFMIGYEVGDTCTGAARPCP